MAHCQSAPHSAIQSTVSFGTNRSPSACSTTGCRPSLISSIFSVFITGRTYRRCRARCARPASTSNSATAAANCCSAPTCPANSPHARAPNSCSSSPPHQFLRRQDLRLILLKFRRDVPLRRFHRLLADKVRRYLLGMRVRDFNVKPKDLVVADLQRWKSPTAQSVFA